MKVEAVLAKKGGHVLTIDPRATILAAAQRLRLERVGALVVMDGEAVAGLVSERDIVRAFAEHKGDVADVKVADIMSRGLLTCTLDESLTHVMALMTRHRVRHLPVFEKGRLVGLVSIGDAVKHRLDELELEASVLRDAYIASH